MPFARRLHSLLIPALVLAGTVTGVDAREFDKRPWSTGNGATQPVVGDTVEIFEAYEPGVVRALVTIDALEIAPAAITTTPPIDMTFVAVSLTIENRSGTDLTLTPATFDLILADGTTVNNALFTPTEAYPELPYTAIPPSETIEGSVVYHVPDDASVGGVVAIDVFQTVIVATTDTFPTAAPGEARGLTHTDVYTGTEYDIEVTVSDVIYRPEGITPRDGFRYIAFELTYGNQLLDDGFTVTPASTRLVIDGNRLASTGHGQSSGLEIMDTHRLRGGQESRSYIVFEVPADATTWDLVVSPFSTPIFFAHGSFV